MKKGFFASDKKKDKENYIEGFEEAGELVVPAETFDGVKEGLIFKNGPSGTGYYKDDVKARMAKAKSNLASKKPTISASDEKLKKSMFSSMKEETAPAMIDLATLNSAIGSYGGSRFGNLSSGGNGMKSLFSL